MLKLYLSTDAYEAEHLIDPHETANHQYVDISIPEGLKLEKRLGFNPMSYVEFNSNATSNILQSISQELIKLGLIIAIENKDSDLQVFKPNNLKEREETVKTALGFYNPKITFHAIQPLADAMLISSNTKEFETQFRNYKKIYDISRGILL